MATEEYTDCKRSPTSWRRVRTTISTKCAVHIRSPSSLIPMILLCLSTYWSGRRGLEDKFQPTGKWFLIPYSKTLPRYRGYELFQFHSSREGTSHRRLESREAKTVPRLLPFHFFREGNPVLYSTKTIRGVQLT